MTEDMRVTQRREGRMRRRVRRCTSRDQRRPEHGEAYVDDCPACGCGNLILIRKRNGKLFVGCDCFHAPLDCPCEFGYAVPEGLSIQESELAGMTEFERAKAMIARAPRCLNHWAPMTVRTGRYGLFARCTVKGCEWKKKIDEAHETSLAEPLGVI